MIQTVKVLKKKYFIIGIAANKYDLFEKNNCLFYRISKKAYKQISNIYISSHNLTVIPSN